MDGPGYFLVKLVAYTLWSYLGLRIFRPQASFMIARAVGYGTLRLIMGLFFGVAIFFLASFWAHFLGTGLPQNIFTYLGAYVPVRWVEWTIMAALLSPGLLQQRHWFIGTGSRDGLWRFGGILISCLADIPLIESLGGVVPTGRFLC